MSSAERADEVDRLRRRVLWAMPTGLYVLGSRAVDAGQDRCNLMTASLVVQVATDPKLVAVAVDVAAVTHRLVAAGGAFTISLLDRADRVLVRRFVKPVEPDAVVWDAEQRPTSIAGEAVASGVTGAPYLARAAGWMDCEVRHRLEFASHTLFVGEVVDVGGPDGMLPPVLRMEDTKMNYGG
jgi:flavin reductase (DIM6/NTAB) family NADH-FMN oxidoreductase RutF